MKKEGSVFIYEETSLTLKNHTARL